MLARNALKYGAALVATFLVVTYGTQAGQVISAASQGGVGVVKAFQGRG